MSEELIKRLRGFWLSKDSGDTKIMRRLMTEAADALSRPAPAVQVPEGYVLVPVEPTPEMFKAANKYELECAANNYGGCADADGLWAVMVGAAIEARRKKCSRCKGMDYECYVCGGKGTYPTPAPVAQEARDSAFMDAMTYGQGFLLQRADGTETHIPAESVRQPVTVATEAVAQGGGVDVEKVMALVERYGVAKWDYGATRVLERAELADELHAEIRALLASPAPAGTVGDGWIAVGDRLPLEIDGDTKYRSVSVIATDGRTVAEMEFMGGDGCGKPWVAWTTYGEFRPEAVTAWQPLPPAPAATKKEEGHE